MTDISILALLISIGPIMSKRTKFLIRFFAILIVLVSVFAEMDIIKANFLDPYKYWMNVLAFGMLLLTSK
jgi:hypothetical protein